MSVLKRYPILVSIPVLLVIWFATTRLGWIGKSLLADPVEVLRVFGTALRPQGPTDDVFHHAADTIVRALTGWAIALAIGLAVGLALGLNNVAYRAAEPVLEFVRSVPPIMAFPPLLVAFSFGPPAYFWTIAVGCAPIMVLSVARGIQQLDPLRIELLHVHDVARPVRLLASLVEILPSAFLGARVTFSMSLIIAIVTEMVFSPRSGFALGSLAKDSEISFATATFYACVVVLGLYTPAPLANLLHDASAFLEADG